MAEEKKKSWFARHKVLTVVGVVILLGIIGSAAGGNKTNTSSTSNSGTTSKPTSSAKTYRFADRADKQKNDVELALNETGTIGGVKLTVTDATYKTSVSDYETADSGKTYAIVTVNLENTSDSTKPYNPYDFRVQTASGQVLDETFVTLDNQLNAGDLVNGGKVSGQIPFEVPVEDGHQYLIWKPSAFSSSRAIVQIK